MASAKTGEMCPESSLRLAEALVLSRVPIQREEALGLLWPHHSEGRTRKVEEEVEVVRQVCETLSRVLQRAPCWPLGLGLQAEVGWGAGGPAC